MKATVPTEKGNNMAYDVKKTDHLFVPFNRFGRGLRDSKGNTKIYKDLKTLKQHNKKEDDKPAWLASDYYVDYMEYVPVIRCKDCKHWVCGVCDLHSEKPDEYNTGLEIEMFSDDFCSYGERKDNDK